MINKDRMQMVLALGSTSVVNCWGATKYVLGKAREMEWVDEKVMKRWLKSKTTEISHRGLVMGDIVSLWDDGRLIHTATYLGRGVWFHKIGANYSAKQKLADVLAIYEHEEGRSLKLRYHRLLK